METLRLSRPAVVRIERDHGSRTARVLVDGNDVSGHVTTVSWSMQAGQMPCATVTFMDVEIVADADLVEPSPAEQEFRAVDLTVLDLKPDDTILLRHAQNLDDETCDRLIEICKRELPGRRVLVLDGGLELSALRAEPKLAEPEPSLAEIADGLEPYAPEAAAFFRSVGPVEPREHVVNRDQPDHAYTPISIDPASLAKLTTGEGFVDVAAQADPTTWKGSHLSEPDRDG